jgi:membrane protein YdbS with pleckstrin-like domain
MTNESKPSPAIPTQELPWRFWRRRLALLQFWRGRDKRWYFFGQQPDEQVRLLVRRHWWFLVQPALPFIASIIVLMIILGMAATLPAWASLWYLLELIAFLAVLGTGGWFAYRDLISWWYETYIITNKRIIYSRGLLAPTRSHTPIEKVQQVGLDINNNLLGLVLGFGALHVHLTGGKIDIRDVPNPPQVRDALIGAWEDFKAKKPKDSPVPAPKNTALSEALNKLGELKPVPELPKADENLPPVFGADPFIGPRRTFGGFLRIPCNVRYMAGEYTVKYVQRSLYVLWRNLLIPILLLLVALPLTVAGPEIGFVPKSLQPYWWFGMGLIVVGILISMLLVYMNYTDDVYILTNRRIIDIQRYFFFFFEKHEETEYKNIRDVKVQESLLQRLLDVGNVYVETPGNNPDIIMDNVDQPFTLQDEILGIRAHKDKEDGIKKENAEKTNLHKWFSTVITQLEETTTSRGAPNLRNMDLLSAMAHAQDCGLDVVVGGEAAEHPEIPPGHVVSQDPPPGTLMEKGSQIEVVLSKRVPAPPRAR